MKVPLNEIARKTGLSNIQVLFELALMGQPPDQCWPECDDGFVQTLLLRHKANFVAPEASASNDSSEPSTDNKALPISVRAAEILNKLMSKKYGSKPIQVFTLTKKWVHGSSEDDVRELVKRGNLEWVDGDRNTVRLCLDKLGDTEKLVQQYRALRS